MNHTVVFILLKTTSRKIISLNPDRLGVRYCALNTPNALQ